MDNVGAKHALEKGTPTDILILHIYVLSDFLMIIRN